MSYPIEIRRCRHVKTNGTQCGSPALKGKELCFYHEQNQPREVELYLDGDRYCDGTIMIPPFEDAHSIQMVLRHIVQLMLQRRIERKDAGLALYALQIASGNLKQMQAEKPTPTQVVVEPEKAAETPLGMTPWSASGQGHDPEEAEGEDAEGEEADEEEAEGQDSSAPPPSPEEIYDSMTHQERRTVRNNWHEKGLIDPLEYEMFFTHDAADPLLLTLRRLSAERDRRQCAAEQEAASADAESGDPGPGDSQTPPSDLQTPAPNLQTPAPNAQTPAPNSEASTDPDLPPGTIQACQARSASGSGAVLKAGKRKLPQKLALQSSSSFSNVTRVT